MIARYYVPVGCSVGKPAGGIYNSGLDVPQEDIAEFGEDRVAHMLTLGRLAVREDKKTDQEPEREGRTGPVTPGQWNRNPQDLEGRNLDQLNVMVMEIDDSVELFETIEEAVYFLSADYVADKQEV